MIEAETILGNLFAVSILSGIAYALRYCDDTNLAVFWMERKLLAKARFKWQEGL